MFMLNNQTLKSWSLIKAFFLLYIFQVVFNDACVGFQRVRLGGDLQLQTWTAGPQETVYVKKCVSG